MAVAYPLCTSLHARITKAFEDNIFDDPYFSSAEAQTEKFFKTVGHHRGSMHVPSPQFWYQATAAFENLGEQKEVRTIALKYDQCNFIFELKYPYCHDDKVAILRNL